MEIEKQTQTYLGIKDGFEYIGDTPNLRITQKIQDNADRITNLQEDYWKKHNSQIKQNPLILRWSA